MAFTAKYHGWCAACHQAVEAGDEIAYEDGEIVHEDCADTPYHDPDDGPGNPPLTFL